MLTPLSSFPPNWPAYCPAQKVADWLEFYAKSMELNVWTSSTVLRASRSKDRVSPKTGKLQWDVTVKREDGTERIFHVDHVVFSLGLGAGAPVIPQIPGRVSSFRSMWDSLFILTML